MAAADAGDEVRPVADALETDGGGDRSDRTPAVVRLDIEEAAPSWSGKLVFETLRFPKGVART